MGAGQMNEMDEIDNKILRAIGDRSTAKWVVSANVRKALRLEKMRFKEHLARLKALGYVEMRLDSYPENHIGKNAESQIRLTNLARSVLASKR
jgi:RIO-like serine/threonine protein kinase